MAVCLGDLHQCMTAFTAKMGHVNYSCRIVGQKLKDYTLLQRLQPFAEFEDGQGAQQANGVHYFANIAHNSQI